MARGESVDGLEVIGKRKEGEMKAGSVMLNYIRVLLKRAWEVSTFLSSATTIQIRIHSSRKKQSRMEVAWTQTGCDGCSVLAWCNCRGCQREGERYSAWLPWFVEGSGWLFLFLKDPTLGASLAVQWLGSCAPVPGWGARITHAVQCGQEKKKSKIEFLANPW